MSNLWINIRFGSRHLQIGPDTFRVSFNPWCLHNKPKKWFEVYEFFGVV